MLNTARRLVGGKWISLGRELGLPISKHNNVEKINKFKRTGVAKFSLIKKISNFLTSKGHDCYSLGNIEKKIILIKGKGGFAKPIYNPKFPINFNTKEGAIIISCLFHDGGIDTKNNEPFYSNSSLKLRERFVQAVNHVVGRVDIISKVKYQRREVIYPKILGILLKIIGLVPGKRPVNNPKFPDFVFNASERFIFEFLSQSIADDGWVYCPKENFGYISFNFTVDLTKFSREKRIEVRNKKFLQHIPNVLLGNKRLFEKIGVKVGGPYFGNEKYYYKEGKERRYTQEWRIYIRDYRSLVILSKNLRIPLDYKQVKLEEISKRERLVSRHNPKILRAFSNFEEGFTYEELSNLLKFPLRTIRYQLSSFCEDGFLKKSRIKREGRTKFEYFLTEKGRRELELIGK
jgi:hypothetical protein